MIYRIFMHPIGCINIPSIATRESLYFFPSIVGNNCTTCWRRTGNVTVHATGFDITCGYFHADTALEFIDTSKDPLARTQLTSWTLGGSTTPEWIITATQTGVISAIFPQEGTNGSTMFYSTIPIRRVFRAVSHPPNGSGRFASWQISWYRVTRNYENQIDLPYADLEDAKNSTSGNLFVESWDLWYSVMPPSYFPRNSFDGDNTDFLTVADLVLVQKSNLRSIGQTNIPASVTLHDVENALSILVASMFWTGHIPPVVGPIGLSPNSPQYYTLETPQTPPFLLQGNSTATVTLTQIRLDLSIIALDFSAPAAFSTVYTDLRSAKRYQRYPDKWNRNPTHNICINLRRARLVGWRMQNEESGESSGIELKSTKGNHIA
ncbi:hypothetical protein C8R44DRAFT_886347 [Mycena epipterygia]|nr:hypothetical protein C8R44DRAFT_886347 [Mycena epipterygia]